MTVSIPIWSVLHGRSWAIPRDKFPVGVTFIPTGPTFAPTLAPTGPTLSPNTLCLQTMWVCLYVLAILEERYSMLYCLFHYFSGGRIMGAVLWAVIGVRITSSSWDEYWNISIRTLTMTVLYTFHPPDDQTLSSVCLTTAVTNITAYAYYYSSITAIFAPSWEENIFLLSFFSCLCVSVEIIIHLTIIVNFHIRWYPLPY